MKKINNMLLRYIATVVLTIMFLCSAGYLIWYHFDKPYNPLENVETLTLVDSPTDSSEQGGAGLNMDFEGTRGDIPNSVDSSPPKMLGRYLEAYDQNNDLYAWIMIPALDIDLPVMYTPNDYDWYLRKDYLGKYSMHGTLFTDLELDFNDLHVIIYGHNMKDNTMFGGLDKYVDPEFFEQHSTFQVSDLYHDYTYEVIAVVKDKVHTKDEDCFKYYNYIGNSTQEYSRFSEWLLTAVNSRNLDQITEDTRILMLSTCSYHTNNGRLVVVARHLDS